MPIPAATTPNNRWAKNIVYQIVAKDLQYPSRIFNLSFYVDKAADSVQSQLYYAQLPSYLL